MVLPLSLDLLTKFAATFVNISEKVVETLGLHGNDYTYSHGGIRAMFSQQEFSFYSVEVGPG